MKGLVKYHSAVTAIQLGFVVLSLCISSLGIIIKHPYVTNFWYLGLFGIVMMLATSLVVAVVLVLARIFKPDPTWNQRWLSAPKSIRT
jgi:lysylphosphatidylglycerol synthetase-like protein (DUF2156 family)